MWVCFTRNCCVSLQKACNLRNENEIVNPCIAAHVLLFNPDILYAHILYMLHKKFLRVAQPTLLRQEKKFTKKLRWAPKLCESHKKYVVATKKTKRETHVD